MSQNSLPALPAARVKRLLQFSSRNDDHAVQFSAPTVTLVSASASLFAVYLTSLARQKAVAKKRRIQSLDVLDALDDINIDSLRHAAINSMVESHRSRRVKAARSGTLKEPKASSKDSKLVQLGADDEATDDDEEEGEEEEEEEEEEQ